tara:strand:+ start:769 stop:1254 length:486 start_codon:yes stop_codon:yes gene_type:complete
MRINSMVKESIKAPDIRLPSTNNLEYSLEKSIGNYVVIYFYPKNDTPGCTLETKDFNKLLPNFKKLNCEIYGISKDNLESHNKFKKKYKIKFNLLSDSDKKVLKKYKVWGKKKFMGREFMGIIRSTFLIDKKGKILKVWKNVKVKGHAEEVLKILMANSKS